MMYSKVTATPKADMDLDCTDEEWAAFIKQVEEMGEREVEQMEQRRKEGKVAEPKQASKTNPSLLYYWTHLVGGGNE